MPASPSTATSTCRLADVRSPLQRGSCSIIVRYRISSHRMCMAIRLAECDNYSSHVIAMVSNSRMQDDETKTYIHYGV